MALGCSIISFSTSMIPLLSHLVSLIELFCHHMEPFVPLGAWYSLFWDDKEHCRSSRL